MSGLEILAVIGGVVSAAGAVAQAGAASASTNYNAKVNERNAIIANQDRKQALDTAEIAANDKRRENARTMSTIRAMYGSSGLDMSGSPLDVIEDSAMELALDEQRIDYEARVQNRQGFMKMQGYKEAATLNKMEAKSAKIGGVLSAFGYLVGGAGNALKLAN